MSHINLNPTYGALFIGVLVSSVLFGVTMLQTLVYFQQYPSDRAWRKLAVSWLWFLDALHLALSAHFVYHYLVSNNANPDALSQIVWSFKLRIVVDSLVVSSVHTLYTSRLWTLLAIDARVEPFGKEARRWSRQKMPVHASATHWIMRRVMPWFVSVLVIIGYAIVVVMCYETIRLDSFDALAHSPCATYVPLASSIIIDGVIAGTLCYFLARCRPKSAAVNGPIRTLMVYTVNTGVITSICSVITMAMMAAFPKTFIPVAIEFLVIKLYINSYMAMLNARTSLYPSSNPRHRRTRTYSSFFPPARARHPVRLGDPLDQKHSPFGSFPPFSASASASSIQLIHISQPSPNPSHALSPHNAPRASPNEADAYPAMGETTEWSRTSPPQTLRVPRLSHPDVRTHEGVVETVLGVGVGVSVAFPAHPHAIALGGMPRMHSYTDSGASSATAVTNTLPLPAGTSGLGARHPLAESAAVYANPIDPLSPAPAPAPALALTPGSPRASMTHPLASGSDMHTGVEGTAHKAATRTDPNLSMSTRLSSYRDRDSLGAPFLPEPERALSPLRFASYSSSTPSCSFSASMSMPGTPTTPRTPVTPVTPVNADAPNTPPKDRKTHIPIRFQGSLSHAQAHTQTQAQPHTQDQEQPPGRRSPSPNPLLPPRPSRPRLPSAYSTTSSEMDRDPGETRRSISAYAASGHRGSVYGSGSSAGRDRDRYTRMVSAARESRRGLRLGDLQGAEREREKDKELGRVLAKGSAQEAEAERAGEREGERRAGVGCMEDERGVWLWGGPGASLS
ncbi:hypothetical protein C8Q73DRAFT_273585 [Cubamyces lactineus]|nr:hypothetical protein C8Q73DRAFT_273585 [Cubamyces lactineus]